VLFITLFILVLVARSAPAALVVPCRINPLAAEHASKSLLCVSFVFVKHSSVRPTIFASRPLIASYRIQGIFGLLRTWDYSALQTIAFLSLLK
jgi:hypothetical protein